MSFFPTKTYLVELNEDSETALAELKQHTDITDMLVSKFTKKAFRGQVRSDSFKLISSEIGLGAFCVLTGEFKEAKGKIKIRIHFVFKILLSFLMVMPAASVAVKLLYAENKPSFIMLLVITAVFLIITRVVMELVFHFVAKMGFNKLKRILGVKEFKELKSQRFKELGSPW